MWNERYSDATYAYGTEPNDFLASKAKHIPMGRVLCLAEGEGRNAVYLAQLGYAVTAVDLSPVGLQKAHDLAQARDVSIATVVADLATFTIEPAAWDGIISIWAHVPPSVRMPLHRQIVDGLKPGGVFILEAYTERQLTMPGRGGPPVAQRERLMALDTLKVELQGLTFVHGVERDRVIQEGRYHDGESAVVQVLAQKAP